MAMKEEREEGDGRRTGRAVKHDRASDGERRVGRPRRIVPLAPSLCKACEQDVAPCQRCEMQPVIFDMGREVMRLIRVQTLGPRWAAMPTQFSLWSEVMTRTWETPTRV